MAKITRRDFIKLLGLGAAAAAVGGVVGVAGVTEAEEQKEIDDKYICISCGLAANEQQKNRHPSMQGFCSPGRCVVNGTAWLVYPDTGEPLYA